MYHSQFRVRFSPFTHTCVDWSYHDASFQDVKAYDM